MLGCYYKTKLEMLNFQTVEYNRYVKMKLETCENRSRSYPTESVKSSTNSVAWETCWVESMLLAEPAETDRLFNKLFSAYKIYSKQNNEKTTKFIPNGIIRKK